MSTTCGILWDGQNKMWLRNSMSWEVHERTCQKGVKDRKPETFKCSGIGNHGRATSIQSFYTELLQFTEVVKRCETHEVFHASRLERESKTRRWCCQCHHPSREKECGAWENTELATFQSIQYPSHVMYCDVMCVYVCVWFCVFCRFEPSLREFVTKHSRSAGLRPSGLSGVRCQTQWVYRARQSWKHSNMASELSDVGTMACSVPLPEARGFTWRLTSSASDPAGLTHLKQSNSGTISEYLRPVAIAHTA